MDVESDSISSSRNFPAINEEKKELGSSNYDGGGGTPG